MKVKSWMGVFLLSLALFCIAAAEVTKLDPDLELEELRPGLFLHRSGLTVEGFGRVECNDRVYINSGEAVVIDTPGSAHLSSVLLDWLEEKELHIQALFVGHTHEDSMGGMEVFHERGILTASSTVCRSLAKEQGKPVSRLGFDGELSIPVGDSYAVAAYFGPGHTQDNAIVYLPNVKVLFGGCLIKADGAGRGNTADADLERWSQTVQKVADAFPEAETIVPGHGKPGGRELLQYTIDMFATR